MIAHPRRQQFSVLCWSEKGEDFLWRWVAWCRIKCS